MGAYNRKDSFYTKAREAGYRSRAAFKLLELDDRFKFLKRGRKVLDVGAWPGGWLQIASEKIGEVGLAVGVDLVEIEGLPGSNTRLLQGDAADPNIVKAALEASGGEFDVVLSDMAPKLSGIKELDAAATLHCAELAFSVAKQTLKSGGTFVVKLFKNAEVEAFVKRAGREFSKIARVELDSTRRTSNEFYFVGQGKKSPPGVKSEEPVA